MVHFFLFSYITIGVFSELGFTVFDFFQYLFLLSRFSMYTQRIIKYANKKGSIINVGVPTDRARKKQKKEEHI